MAERRPSLKTEAPARPTKAPQPLVAQPVRDSPEPSDPRQFRAALNSVALRFPGLRRSLLQGEMRYTPAGFVLHALLSSIPIAFLIIFAVWLLIAGSKNAAPALLILAPIIYLLSFAYMMQVPAVKAHIRAKRIDEELVFAGRHMLIELKSGVPLFDAMLGISRDYGEVSSEFSKIVEKVTLGMPMGVALHSVADNNPSQFFNRVLLQMANSLASGSDVASSLESALEQISREQVIELKGYGQKLNPLVMFFMIFGIIMPSLGIAFVIILASFLGGLGISLGPTALFGALAAIGLVQFIFLSMVENSRPKFDIGL